MAKLNKKGEGTEDSTIVVFVIAIIAMIGIFAIVYFFTDRGSDIAQMNLCRSSIVARDFTDAWPVTCTTKNEGTISGNREEVKEEISKLAAKCWFQFNQGRTRDVFADDHGESTCFVCYYFKIDGGMDEGEEPEVEIVSPEPPLSERSPDMVSMEELYNYMASARNQLPGLAGGQIEQYVGSYYEFNYNGFYNDTPQIVRTRDITTAPLRDFVLDYTGHIPASTREHISEEGTTLLTENRANLLVVAANEFHSRDKTAARQIINGLDLHSSDEKQDGIIVMIDFNHRIVRVHMGSEHADEFQDHNIRLMIREQFETVMTEEDFMNALERLITTIRRNIIGDESSQLTLANHDSYYAYISNYESMFPMLSDIEAGPTYAVAYLSTSTIQRDTSLRGIWEAFKTDYERSATRRIMGGEDPFSALVLRSLRTEGRVPIGEVIRGGVRADELDNRIVIAPSNMLLEYCRINE